MKTFPLLAASLPLALAAGTAAAANLIKNGGFETPATPAGQYTVYQPGQKIGAWTVVGSHDVNTSSTTETNRGVTLDAQKGLAFIDLTGDCDCGGPDTGVEQTVRTIAGHSYTLTFWVGNCVIAGYGTTSTVDVYADNTLLVAAENKRGQGSTRQVWKKFTVSFTATDTKTTLSFLTRDPNGDEQNGLDDVSLVEE